jgi:hypothetical protein
MIHDCGAHFIRPYTDSGDGLCLKARRVDTAGEEEDMNMIAGGTGSLLYL